MLQHSLTRIGGNTFETYSRESKANNSVTGKIAVAPVEEYVFISVTSIAKNAFKDVSLSSFAQPVKIESIYIDSPAADALTFEIFSANNDKIFTFALSRNKTPYEFPTMVIPPDMKIRIIAGDAIDSLRIWGKFVSIVGAIVV